MNTLAFAGTSGTNACSAGSIASTLQPMSVSFGVAIAGLVTAYFLPPSPGARPERVIRWLDLAFLLLRGFTMSSTIVFRSLRRGDGDDVSRGKGFTQNTQPLPAAWESCVGLHRPIAPMPMLYLPPPGFAERALQFESFDAGYIESLRAGDHRTEEHFVGYFTELLHLKLRSRLKSSHAIEDVRQETFARVLRVLRSEGSLRNPERLGAFVNTVCNNVLLEHYRSSSRSQSIDEEGQPELPATGIDVLDAVAQNQLKAKVQEILVELQPRDRELLKAVFLEDRDREEICRQFGVDREYLRVLLYRAKQEFKTEYLKRMGAAWSMKGI